MFMEMSTLFLKKIKKFLSLFLWLFALGNDRINEVVFQKEKSGMEGIALDKTAECKLVLDTAVLAGKIMLQSGAEIHRPHRTVLDSFAFVSLDLFMACFQNGCIDGFKSCSTSGIDLSDAIPFRFEKSNPRFIALFIRKIRFVQKNQAGFVPAHLIDIRIAAGKRYTCIQQFDDKIDQFDVFLHHTPCLGHMTRIPRIIHIFYLST